MPYQPPLGILAWPKPCRATGHAEGGRNGARFASLIGTRKTRGVEPYAYLQDLFTKLANRHLDKDFDAPMPWACVSKPTTSNQPPQGLPDVLICPNPGHDAAIGKRPINGAQTPVTVMLKQTASTLSVSPAVMRRPACCRHGVGHTTFRTVAPPSFSKRFHLWNVRAL